LVGVAGVEPALDGF